METCSLSITAEGAVYSGTIFFPFIHWYSVWIRPIHQLEDSILEIQDLRDEAQKHVFFLIPLKKQYIHTRRNLF